MSLEPAEPQGVNLARALCRTCEKLNAELATEKAETCRLRDALAEMTQRFDYMKAARDAAVSVRVRLEEEAAYWKGQANK